VLPACDSVGFNASEAKQFARAMGERGASEADALLAALEVCGHAVLHTCEYSVHAVRKSRGRNGNYLYALALGNLLAGYLAASGEFPEQKGIANFTFAVNERAVSRRKDFEKTWAFMPALKVAQPKTGTGLGDCFTVGFSSAALRSEMLISRSI